MGIAVQARYVVFAGVILWNPALGHVGFSYALVAVTSIA